MNIIVGKNCGFCAGVKNSISKAEEELKKNNGKLDCLGEIIHNKEVVSSLENRGLRTIDSIDDAKNKVLIRAHGVSKDTYDIAKDRNIELIDLTCPKVLKIHKLVDSFSKDGYFIFLFGIKNHPETIGTISFCSNNSYIIENENDIQNALNKLYESKIKKVLIISQTTFSVGLFNQFVDIITNTLDSSYNIHIEESICNATSLRQKETEQIASAVDLMIIIGGKNSSNTKKLYEISIKKCKNVLFVQTKDDLDLKYLKNVNSIGIMAGASTPSYIIEEIYNICLKI